MSNYSFGNYICELREKKGLSQSQLGEKLGVTNKAVSKWENGGAYPSTDLMLPLAETLGVTIEDLYKVISESKAPKTRLKIFLEWLVQHSKAITIICAFLAFIPYVLFAIFSNAEDKKTLLILAPLASAMVFVMFYLFFVFYRKNPLASAKGLDFYTVSFLTIMTIGYFSVLPYFFTNFPNGFSPSLCISPLVFVAVIQSLKKRYR